ncbi:MAG TPA: hypothetical protein VF556_03630 [Pyrinomonadaceae bacterium]
MKRQNLRFILNIFGMLTTAVVIAVLIDCYHFSWTGFLFNKAGLCEYKTISTPVKDGFPQKLTYDFDPQYIAKEMLKNPNYEVSGYYNNRGAVVTRKFGDISYQISFQNSRGSYEGFNLNTSKNNEKYSFPSVSGENCAVPNHKLKQNVFLMIDDLPLTDSQKDEMKKYVSVASAFRGNFW